MALGALATIAADAGWWTWSTLLDHVSTLVTLLVLLLCTQYLSRKIRTEARRAGDDTAQFGEYVLESVIDFEKANAELQRLMRFHLDDLAALKNKVGVLETKVEVNRITTEVAEDKVTTLLQELQNKLVDRHYFNDFKKQLRVALRESERRVMSSAPKAIEVRRMRERVEAAERRILGAIETEMYSQNSNSLQSASLIDHLAERVEDMTQIITSEHSHASESNNGQKIATDRKAIDNLGNKIKRHVTSTVRDSTRQVEALIHLSSRFEDKKLPMPSTGGFAIDPQALGHLIALIEEHRPKRILELGSGTSTVWFGYLCRSYGAEIITVDHLEEYLELTRESLRMHHLDGVESRLAPLVEMECHGDTYNWYSLETFEGLQDIDMLIIDGPPESTGRLARYPALPTLVDSLSTRALVVLDDTHRENELNILQKWLELYPEFDRLADSISRLGVLQRRE